MTPLPEWATGPGAPSWVSVWDGPDGDPPVVAVHCAGCKRRLRDLTWLPDTGRLYLAGPDAPHTHPTQRRTASWEPASAAPGRLATAGWVERLMRTDEVRWTVRCGGRRQGCRGSRTVTLSRLTTLYFEAARSGASRTSL